MGTTELQIWLLVATFSTLLKISECTPTVTGLSPTRGSLNGETRLTIEGAGFSKNQFNFGSGNDHLGNRVTLVSSTQQCDCPVHKDGSHETQIMCYTKRMPSDDFSIRVSVDGTDIDTSNICGGCIFTPHESNTPTITSIEPRSGPPGTLVKLTGKVFTDKYGSNTDESSNERDTSVLRVYVGGQSCNLKIENAETDDAFYGMQLDNGGSSDNGYIICKIGETGTKIGNINASFILSNEFGRSDPDSSLFQVSRNNQIYMFQTYAEVTSVSPASGSVEGGTLISITGNNFDQTRSSPVVEVGGTPCTVVGNVTKTLITCQTAAKPVSVAAPHPGNRGLMLEIWNATTKTYAMLSEVSALNSAAPDYQAMFVDEAYFTDNTMDQFVSKMRGFFIPPFSGDYSFHIMADDGAELYLSTDHDPANMLKIASSPRASNYNSYSSQNSVRKTLSKDSSYYMEVYHRDVTLGAFAKISARLYTTTMTSAHTGNARHEVQRIEVRSVINREIQSLTFTGFQDTTPTPEVQVVTVEESSPGAGGQFRLSLYSVFTDVIEFRADATVVATAVDNLPFFESGESVSVTQTTTSNNGVQYTITFTSDRGDFPSFGHALVTGSLDVTVSETTMGTPSGKMVALSIASVPASLVAPTATSKEVQSALEKLFTTLCPSVLTNPAGKKMHYTFESDSSTPSYNRNLRVSDTEAFCGKTVVKNPSYVFKSDSNNDPLSLTQSPKLCFAHQGPILNDIQVFYSYLDQQLEKTGPRWSTLTNVIATPTSNTDWHYSCISILSEISTIVPTGSNFFLERVYLRKSGDIYVDEVYLGSTEPVTDYEGIVSRRMLPAKPNGYFIDTVSVTDSGGSHQVTLVPFKCGYGFPLFSSTATQVPSGASVGVSQVQPASPPIQGTFSLTFLGQSVSGIPADIDSASLEDYLETIDGMGQVSISHSGDCANFDWTITYNGRPGDQPLIQVDSSLLTGISVTMTPQNVNDGHLLFDPILGELLRTAHQNPQVMLYINDVPTRCTNNCDFQWLISSTPTVIAISPGTGLPLTVATITGTGFSATAGDNSVIIGGVACTVTTAATTSITCTIGNGPEGIYKVDVNVAGAGLAQHSGGTISYIYSTGITAISPSSCSLGGGVNLTVDGYGFRNDATVTVGGQNCPVISRANDQLICLIPPKTSAGSVSVVVAMPGVAPSTAASQLAYDASITAQISSMSPTTSEVKGGAVLTIDGTGFGGSCTLMIGGTAVTPLTYNTSRVTATLPPLPPGTHPVQLIIGSDGAAVLSSTSAVPAVDYILTVTNVHPLRGSLHGGTKVTITGDGFSSDADIKIGGHACTVTTSAATQIVCEITDTATTHQVDNQGVHFAFGKGYGWNPENIAVNIGDKIHWSWDYPSWVAGMKPRLEQTTNASSTVPEPDGFSSGPSGTKTGAYENHFTKTGTYYFWSGFVDIYTTTWFRGSVTVTSLASHIGELRLKIGGLEALYDTNSGVSNPSDPGPCVGTLVPISGCSDPAPTGGDASKFNFQFWSCLTPTVTDLSRNNGTANDNIVLTETGLSTTSCQNEVKFGSHFCTVSSGATCQLDSSTSPPIGVPQSLSVRVGNLGNALISINGKVARTFAVIPVVSGISPTLGSRGGHAQLTITGAGFQGNTPNVDVAVTIGSYPCPVSTLTYTSLVCLTPTSISDGAKLVEVKVSVGGQMVPAQCDVLPNCDFIYEYASTASVTSVTPSTVDGQTTTLTINGTKFGTTSSHVSVTVGGEVCSVAMVTDSAVQCTITTVPVGVQDVVVDIAQKGHAVSTVQVISQATISGISPIEGSTNGGTVVTITGNGFIAGTTVTIDGTACLVNSSVTLSQVVCMTAAHVATDNRSLIVTSAGTSYPTQLYSYTSGATPVITSVSPPTGSSGDTVTVTGSNFGANNADNSLTLDGRPCNVTSSSPTQIQCQVADYQAGSYAFQVDVVGKGLSNNNVMFGFTMTATSISPDRGSTPGDQTVTISGSGFDSSTTVSICSQSCVRSDTHNSTATQFVCVTPAASSSSTQVCSVVVTVNSATQTLSYTYDSALTPAITGVSPTRGGTGGGTTVTITGTGFGSNTANCDVSIGGATCVVSTVTNVQIVCATGARSPSVRAKVRVEVSGNGQAIQTSADYHYVDVWSSVFSWGGVSLPTDGDLVVIQAGQTIYLDTDTAQLKMLLIQGGELIFDEKDVELKADNILVTNGGLLQVGTEANPFQHKAIITLYGHHRTKELPIYGTKSMAVREGTLDLHGLPMPITWTRLAVTAAAGSYQITLQDQVDWNVGDQIVIATTGHRHTQSQNERHEIQVVDGNKRTLTLKQPLAFEHISVTETFGVSANAATLEFAAEVGLLTHNVVVRGYSDPQWIDTIEACPDGFDTGEFATQTCFQGRFGEEMGSDQFGAQVMLHARVANQHLSTGRIEYVEFFHVGQAFRLGRYPVHFHLNGDMSHSYVRGCGIHESFNRAVNIHGTHNMLVEHNVIYNIMGGAFFLEDGIETGNIMQYNLGVFVRESSSLLNDDVTPATFWVTNPNNTVRHNAAAGGTHFGFWYRMHDHPEGPSHTTSVCPKVVNLGAFFNNSAHSFGWFGLWIFPTYTPRLNGACGESTIVPVVFENFFSWNNDKGAEAVNSGALQFRGFQLVNNNKAGYEGKLIIEGEEYTNNSPLIENSLIVGHGTTFPSQGCTNGGIVFAYGSGFQVRNVEFVNFDSNCSVFSWTRIAGTCGHLCGGFLHKTSGLTFTNAPNRGVYAWQFEGIVEDLDGTLCGSNNCKVVPSTGTLPPSCTSFPSFNRGIPASVCPASVKFHRFAFNNIMPSSLLNKRAIFTNDYGTSFMDFAAKRITHKPGWVIGLVSGQSYNLTFENAPHQTNLSFTGRLYQFVNDDHVFLRQAVSVRPDRLKSDSRGFINATATSLDPAIHYNGDWEFNQSTSEISILVSARKPPVVGRRKRASPHAPIGATDIDVTFEAFKCYFTDCIPPPDPNTVPPATARPSDFVLWSNPNSWPQRNNTLPVDGDDIIILKDVWMVVDVAIPSLNTVIIYGGLEFDQGPSPPYRDFVLNATHIIVLGGRLIIGWPGAPFLGTAQIILRGSWASPEFVELTNAPPVGAKVIGAFGGLDLHGQDVGVAWTRLASTANPGDTVITLDQPANWTVGSEIVITPTSYDMWETETFVITAVSSDGYSLTLNGSLAYRHIVHTETINGTNITMAGEVGLLTRNIKIVGEDYPDMFKESFGARVLVAIAQQGNSLYVGYARLDNVEFVHTGQEGYVAFYDPRYSLAFLDAGTVSNIKPSYVTKCAFHNGFSPAIGVYGTHGLPIEDNVVHHTVWWGIETMSDATALRRNLVTLVIWDGAYQNRSEDLNVRYNGGINAIKAKGLELDGNVVSGCERAAYRVSGVDCGSAEYGHNIAHSSLLGFGIFPKDELTGSCKLISNFTMWKCRDVGIYYQNSLIVEIRDNTLVENTLGVIALILGPSAIGHQYANKTALIKDMLIVGATSSFDCTLDQFKFDENIALSGQGRTWNNDGSHIGLAFSSFMQGSNKMPKKPFYGAMTYPAIMGVLNVQDVTFAHFNTKCGRNDFAVTSNDHSDDGIHPIESRRITLIDVPTNNKIFYYRPNVGKINSADCVDMDCDALKKTLYIDEDGSFLDGSPGAVIPESEWEWNGDPRRGLGDYRIPKEMLVTLSGAQIPVSTVAPNKGVIRSNSCVYRAAWQAYECHDLDYEMLIVESMDTDTETRRLSPVAIVGNGYLDLINGPQDHGWCSGYTCRKRISTFMALVATDEEYLMHFTSTSPQHLRYFLLNSNDSQSITLAVWYSQPNRRDVYVNGVFIPPKNHRTVNGAYILDPPTYPGEFKPNVSDTSGANFFDRDSGIVYITIRGDMPVEVKTDPSIIVSFQFPAMSVDTFFGEQIIMHLAAFFDLPPDKVRLVNIVRETAPAGRRRKRSAGNDEVVIEIGDPPSPGINDSSAGDLSLAQLQNVSATLVNEIQLGNISQVLNSTVVGVAMVDVLPEPGSPEWDATTTDSPYTVIVEASELRFYTTAVPRHEGVPFLTQPKIQVLDPQGQPISNLGTPSQPWQITAALRSGGTTPAAQLNGTLTVQFVNGWANFTDLQISHFGSYYIEFNLTVPTDTNFTIATSELTVAGRPIKSTLKTMTYTVIENTYFEIGIELRDSVTSDIIPDISWKGHMWFMTAELSMPELFSGTLEGSNETTFSVSTSSAHFYSLNFTSLGVYPLKLHIYTTPSGYDFYHEVQVVVKTQAQTNIVVEETKEVGMKFNSDYNSVVGSNDKAFSAMMGNHFAVSYPTILMNTVSVAPGSIMVTFSISGGSSSVNSTVHGMCGSIQNGTNFSFNSFSLTLSGHLTVGGVTYYGALCGPITTPEDSTGFENTSLVLIIALSVVSATLICVVIAIILWKCKVYPKTKTRDLSSYTNYLGQTTTIEDILFREQSFMSIRDKSGGMAHAPAATNIHSQYPVHEKGSLPL